MKYKAKEKKPKMMSECQIDTMIFIQTQFKSMHTKLTMQDRANPASKMYIVCENC